MTQLGTWFHFSLDGTRGEKWYLVPGLVKP